MKLAPIVLFVYNRPWHTRQTVEALQKNILAKQSELFIYSDGPKNETDRKKVEEVRNYIRTIRGFKSITIRERQKNLGLANSVIRGVTEIVNKHGTIIVLEDDLLTSRYFLRFMNDALNYYKDEKKVISIHGYVYPVRGPLPETFFLKDTGCWGWATWKRGWVLFDSNGLKLLAELNKRTLTSKFDYNNSYPFTNMLEDQIEGRVNSWAIRWYASAFIKAKLTLYPKNSLVFHNGDDGSGTNSHASDKFKVKVSTQSINIEDIPKEENPVVLREYAEYFRSIRPPLVVRTGKRVFRGLYKLLN